MAAMQRETATESFLASVQKKPPLMPRRFLTLSFFASQCSAKVCLSALIVFKPLAGLELAALCLISPNTVTQGEIR